MEILKGAGAVIVIAFVFNMALLWSNNLVFCMAGKARLWIVTAGLIGLVGVVAFHALGLGHSTIFWGAGIALLLRIPPPTPDGADEAEMTEAVDEAYETMGVRRGRLKYRFGLGAYVLGFMAGYLLTFAHVVDGDS